MSKNHSSAVTLTREQNEQRRLAAAEDLLDGVKSQAQIARDHGVTRAAVAQWNATLEEEGIEGLKSTNDEGNQGPKPQLDEQDREHPSNCSKREHTLTAGKLISGQPSVSLHSLSENSISTTHHATAREFSASVAIVQSNPSKKPPKKPPKRSSAGSNKRANTSKKADQRRNHPLY